MIKIELKTSKNGNTKQLLIDNDKKTIKSGYFLFRGADAKITFYSTFLSLKNAFLNDGYKEL